MYVGHKNTNLHASARALWLYCPTHDSNGDETAAATTSYVGVMPLMCRRTSFLSHCVLLLSSTTYDCACNMPSCASTRALYFGNDGKECWRQNPLVQAHELSISSHRAQAHELLIMAVTTTYVDDEILQSKCPRHTHHVRLRRRQQQWQWWRQMSTTRPRARAPCIFIFYRATVTTTTTIGNNEQQVSDGEASCASTQHIHIVLRNGNEDNKVKRSCYASNTDTTTSQATSNLDAHEPHRHT